MEIDGKMGVHLDGSITGGVSRLEVIEGPSGRRRRSKTERARIAVESMMPGVTVTDVARQSPGGGRRYPERSLRCHKSPGLNAVRPPCVQPLSDLAIIYRATSATTQAMPCSVALPQRQPARDVATGKAAKDAPEQKNQ